MEKEWKILDNPALTLANINGTVSPFLILNKSMAGISLLFYTVSSYSLPFSSPPTPQKLEHSRPIDSLICKLACRHEFIDVKLLRLE